MEDVYIGNPANLVVPIGKLRAILDRLGAAAPGQADAGMFNGCKVGLFKNDLTPTKDTLLADLTACDFTGYAISGAITWGAAFEGDDGSGEMVGSVAQFVQTADDPEPQSAYGYYIVNGAADALLAAERFPSPVVFDGAGAAQVVVPKLSMPRP